MTLELRVNNLPDKFVVHHLDGNSKNNCIDNLALITITAHNRIHSHSPWNKGLTKQDHKWREALEKARITKSKNYLVLCSKTVQLQSAGHKLREIASLQGISRRQVSDRIKAHKNHVKN